MFEKLLKHSSTLLSIGGVGFTVIVWLISLDTLKTRHYEFESIYKERKTFVDSELSSIKKDISDYEKKDLNNRVTKLELIVDNIREEITDIKVDIQKIKTLSTESYEMIKSMRTYFLPFNNGGNK